MKIYMSKLQTYFHTIWKVVFHPQDNGQAMLLLLGRLYFIHRIVYRLLRLVDLLLQHLHQDTQNLGVNGNFTIISICHDV